ANGTLSAVSSSDGGITWTATLTPTAGITSASNSVRLNNGGVTDLAGNVGSGLTLSNNYTIDQTRPTASIVIADNALSAGETSLVTITFSEAVSGFDNSDLNVPNGTLSTVSSNDGGITWTATFTPNANVNASTGQISLNSAGVTDLAGNAGSGIISSGSFTVDTTRPSATIVVADNALSAGETTLVTFTFSQAVSGFSNADLSVANGTLSAVSSSDGGITWTATFTPNANVTDAGNLITLDNTGVTNASGSTGSGTTASNNYTIDTQRPTATIVVTDSLLAIGETSRVTITFSEAVSGFSNADLTVANGTLSAVSSNDGGITWTATLTPNANAASNSNVVTLDNGGVTDLAGNAGSGTTQSNSYAVDQVRPTASIVIADSTLSAGETSQVTITFSEAVNGFSNADLTAANGTLSAVSSNDGGITWTATFTPNANVTDASNLITLNNTGVADASGNTGSGITSSNNYAIDTVRPTATITVANPNLAIGQTSLVTFAFSERVTNFDLSDISVGNGSLSGLSSSDSGLTWTATLTPDANITAANNFIVLDSGRINDLAGNAGTTVALSSNYSIDNQRPTANISIANPNLATGQTSLVTFAFSEPVNNFTLADVSVANGTLSNLASSDGGATWTATLTPTANVTDPSNFIVLDSSTVTDRAGNAGTGIALSPNYAITTTSLTGDPQFRIDAPAPLVNTPNLPLQPALFGPPTGNLGSPLSFSPLFEQRTTGGGLPPVGNIFITNRALAPSFIAQVFDSSSVGGPGSGFTGFNSGEGSVFGSSTLSTLFSRESATDSSTTVAFNSAGSNGLRDSSQSIQAGFGALTLGQQLQQITDNEQEKLRALAWALGEVGVSEAQA
ncbi:Ig-like domain-containing protein, partial [Pseudomonas amygdali]